MYISSKIVYESPGACIQKAMIFDMTLFFIVLQHLSFTIASYNGVYNGTIGNFEIVGDINNLILISYTKIYNA